MAPRNTQLNKAGRSGTTKRKKLGRPSLAESEGKPSTVERILSSAAKLFAEKGYLGTGMRDLEDEVGIRRGALYYHIGDKENLLYEICSTSVQDLNVGVQQIVEGDGTPEEKLRAIARVLIDAVVEKNDTVTVFFRDWMWLDGARKKKVLADRDKFEAMVESVFQEGIQQSGWVDRGPLMTKVSLGMLNYTYLWFRPSGKVKAGDLADLLVDTLLDGLNPRP